MSSALKPAIGSSGGGQTATGGGAPVTGTNKGLAQPMQHGVPSSGHAASAAHMQQQVYAAAQAAHTSTMQNIMSAHQQHGHPALGANMSMAHQHQQAMTAHQQSLQSMQQGLSNMSSLHYSKQMNHNSNMGNISAVNMSPVNMVQERTLNVSQQQMHMTHTQTATGQSAVAQAQPPAVVANPTSGSTSSQNQPQQSNSTQQGSISSQNSNQSSQSQTQQSASVVTANRVEKNDQTSLTAAVAPTVGTVAPAQPKAQANGTIESTATSDAGSAAVAEASGADARDAECKIERSSGANVQENKQSQTSVSESGSTSRAPNVSETRSSDSTVDAQQSTPKSVDVPLVAATPNIVQNVEPTSSANESASQQVQNSVAVSTNQPSSAPQSQVASVSPNAVHDNVRKTPPKSASVMKLATTPRTTNKRKRESVSKSPKSDKSESPAKVVKTDPSARIVKMTPSSAKNQFSDQEDGDKKGTKRVRVRTQPYQSPLPELALITKLSVNQTKQSPASDERLIAFYKNEFIAVRNAEGSFYICQAVQNVYKSSSRIRIRWLSNHDKSTDVYSPDFYDYTDFDCILTNLNLERIDKGKYRLPKNELDRTENILKRAIDVEKGVSTGLSLTEEHPDGLDLSLFRDESQLKKRRASKSKSSSGNRKRKSSHTANSGEDSKSQSDSGGAALLSKKNKSSKRRPSRSSRSKKVTPVKSKPATPVVKKAIKTVTSSAVKKELAKVPTASKRSPTGNVQPPPSAKKNNSVAVARAERAAKRSGESSEPTIRTGPVVDTKKARVLAKVVRKPASDGAASAPKAGVKPTPASAKNPKSARPSSRGTRSSGTPVVAVSSASTSSRRQAGSIKKSIRK